MPIRIGERRIVSGQRSSYMATATLSHAAPYLIQQDYAAYTGDSFLPQAVANGTLLQRLMPAMSDHMLKTAPPGADTKSWRY